MRTVTIYLQCLSCKAQTVAHQEMLFCDRCGGHLIAIGSVDRDAPAGGRRRG